MAKLIKFPSSPLGIAVRRARDERGWTQPVAAEHLGISQQALSKIEDGSTVTPATWRKIADGFGIGRDEFRELMIRSRHEKKLLFKKDNTLLPKEVSTSVNRLIAEQRSADKASPILEIPAADTGIWVPLISWVAAGALTDVVNWSEFDDVRRLYAPDLDPSGQWIALRVDGTSMNKVSPPDSIIFVNLRQRALVPNACYVITDEEGAATYKRYRPDGWDSVSYLPQPEITPVGAVTIIGRVRRSMIDM